MFTVEITMSAPNDAGTITITRTQKTRQGKIVQSRRAAFDEAVEDARSWLTRNDPHEKIWVP